MASIFKKMFTRDLPAGAKIVERNGKKVAQWKSDGRLQSAELTKSGTRIKVRSSTWTAKYRDGDGIVQEVSTGCVDKVAAMAVLNDYVAMAQRVKAKIITSDQAKISAYADTPLPEHITAYVDHLKTRDVHPDRVKTSEKRLKEIATACSWRYVRDLNSDQLYAWLAGEIKRDDRRMSAPVYNSYVQIAVSFGNWLIGKRMYGKRSAMNGEKRLLANPFLGLGKLDERSSRIRKARALTEDELVRLLEAARKRPLEDALMIRKGPKAGTLSAKLTAARRVARIKLGHERALIYKTAILTGLRLNELTTLVVGCLSFGDVPFVRLLASNEKSRKGSTIALRSDLAADLRAWVQGKKLEERVFTVPAGLLRIMDRDLKAAGIPKKDAEGYVVHVHALRHSFGTHLSLAGVAPRVAQAAMRHSNISLTMNVYTDARLLDTASAVESLPNLPLAGSHAPEHAPDHAPTADIPCQSVSSGDIGTTDDHCHQESENPANSRGIAGFIEIGAAGFEPTTSTTPR